MDEGHMDQCGSSQPRTCPAFNNWSPSGKVRSLSSLKSLNVWSFTRRKGWSLTQDNCILIYDQERDESMIMTIKEVNDMIMNKGNVMIVNHLIFDNYNWIGMIMTNYITLFMFRCRTEPRRRCEEELLPFQRGRGFYIDFFPHIPWFPKATTKLWDLLEQLVDQVRSSNNSSSLFFTCAEIISTDHICRPKNGMVV